MEAEYLRHVGSDLDVVNNARVSFDKASDWEYRCSFCDARELDECPKEVQLCVMRPTLKESDKRLIDFLARGCTRGEWERYAGLLTDNQDQEVIQGVLGYLRSLPTHWAPFANGIGITFRITAPIPIMRQVFKHKVGSVESEVSRRYVDSSPEFYYPVWRYAAENVKQGSSETILGTDDWDTVGYSYMAAIEASERFYKVASDIGVAPEQARFGLLQSMYTTAVVTNSLYGWANFYTHRSDDHAQKEIQLLAKKIGEVCSEHFPVSWQALCPKTLKDN